MPQMLFNSIGGFVDLPTANIAAHDIVTDDSIEKINQNVKFASVRLEIIFMGFYKDGDVIPVPTSPVDGYIYARSELLYDFDLYSTRAPGVGFVSGQATAPAISILQPANLYWTQTDIDDETGKVFINISYFKPGGAETISKDGIVKVYCHCQRQSVSFAS